MRLGATFNQLVATCSRDLGITSVASWPVVSVFIGFVGYERGGRRKCHGKKPSITGLPTRRASGRASS